MASMNTAVKARYTTRPWRVERRRCRRTCRSSSVIVSTAVGTAHPVFMRSGSCAAPALPSPPGICRAGRKARGSRNADSGQFDAELRHGSEGVGRVADTRRRLRRLGQLLVREAALDGQQQRGELLPLVRAGRGHLEIGQVRSPACERPRPAPRRSRTTTTRATGRSAWARSQCRPSARARRRPGRSRPPRPRSAIRRSTGHGRC